MVCTGINYKDNFGGSNVSKFPLRNKCPMKVDKKLVKEAHKFMNGGMESEVYNTFLKTNFHDICFLICHWENWMAIDQWDQDSKFVQDKKNR